MIGLSEVKYLMLTIKSGGGRGADVLCVSSYVNIFDGRAFFVSLSVLPLWFIENYIARHRISFFCSHDHMMTQFG